ncbi:ferric reductase like transmembrane component-domain-containing protein [Aspergillus karnatakaensis]|uniref:ferric reductase family protein n=1 Tax=Aspergillus karnatakaensis TaxID=1810916 RepID=UPI003CCCFA1E
MHHDEPDGLPWLNSPVLLHSSREDECSLTPEQCAFRSYRWRYWYEADHVYGLNTIYFLCATVAVFAFFHFASRYAPAGIRRSGLWQKGEAASRYFAYRGYRVPGLGYSIASLGMWILIAVGVVFFFAMSLGPRPYYWPNTEEVSYGGSPPLATRTGWMAVALLPFVLALSTKANMISALTGVPHEKLQVFHHWTSYAMFVLALIHTFPFIVYRISIGSMMYTWRTSVFYWTGVAALIPQAWLTFMSFPSIRNRYYEFFKASHFIIALLFLLFFFLHCNFRLSSWDYFIAAAVVYLASLSTSLIRTHLINGRHTATLTLLPSGLLQIHIPTILSWTPGQHVFIRFSTFSHSLGIHSFTSHPFTITSTAHNVTESAKANEMVLYVKPHRGITGRLAKVAEKAPGSRHTVLLEGPYGGVQSGVMERFHAALIISGGSGGGFSLPIIESALSKIQFQRRDTPTKSADISIVFAARSAAVATWYRECVEEIISRSGTDSSRLSLAIHVTSEPSAEKSETFKGKETPANTGPKSASTAEEEPIEAISDGTSLDTGKYSGGRPNLPQVIAATAAEHANLAIFACGPATMLHDVRNAAAGEQGRILRGGRVGGEVWLHTESFS